MPNFTAYAAREVVGFALLKTRSYSGTPCRSDL
jgi:hypothetical protein